MSEQVIKSLIDAESDEDIKYLLGLYLTEKDIRYRRLLSKLSPDQLRYTCGAFCQGMMFGQARKEEPPEESTGGMAGTCVRMAIIAGFSEGCGYGGEK